MEFMGIYGCLQELTGNVASSMQIASHKTKHSVLSSLEEMPVSQSNF